MKLRYAINDEVLNSLEQMKEEDNIYATYVNPTEINKQQKVTVKALYDYNAMRKDELTFCQGAIITNVRKDDGGWWLGDHGKQLKKRFPANHVEEIVQTKEDNQLGNLQQGAIDIEGCTVGMQMHVCNCVCVCVCFCVFVCVRACVYVSV